MEESKNAFPNNLIGRDLETSFGGHHYRGPIRSVKVTGQVVEIERRWVAYRDGDPDWEAIQFTILSPFASLPLTDELAKISDEKVQIALPPGDINYTIFAKGDNIPKPTK